jgi:hypothetical protein
MPLRPCTTRLLGNAYYRIEPPPQIRTKLYHIPNAAIVIVSPDVV